ncbi:FliA/WhiG family RNA polymerase sigma factor [Pontibacillus litoralis]|nr:FliA/WhiG family RNA polymerase sigma factor [Pontibacillus litoralis]
MIHATSQEHNLWVMWEQEKDIEAANELVRTYLYLVNYHVQRISAHLPQSVSKEDIKSLGLVGLYDAIEKFDTKRDLKFDTYASFRIRGAIMDGLRKEDWLPRSVRDKSKKIEQVSEQLEQQLQRPPTSKEIAQQLGLAPEEVEGIVKDTLLANVLSMEEKPKDNQDHNEGIGHSVPDTSMITPMTNVIKEENYEELAAAIQQLNDKEKTVISLFYDEELTLTEIGTVLELTTSRISQIHTKALFKLRNILSQMDLVHE